jgi:PAS domain S-box-containing protein
MTLPHTDIPGPLDPARVDALLSAITEGVVVIDAAGVVEMVNEVGERILGARRDQMIGAVLAKLPWTAFDADGVRIDRSAHPILMALSTGQAQSERLLRYTRPDGAQVWIATAARPIRAADGRVDGAVSSFRDVTDQRLAEEALRTSEQRYRDLFERNALVQMLVDVESGIIQAVNPAGVQFYKYSQRQLVGKHISLLTGHNQPLFGPVAASMAEGKVATIRRTHYSADEQPHQVDIYASPVASAGRTLLHAVVIDVTARVEAERARTDLAEILDRTPDIVGMFDLEGQLFYTNRAGRQLMGLAPLLEGTDGADMRDIPRNTIRESHSPTDADRVLKEATAAAALTGVWRGETTLRTPDGTERIMNQTVIAHRDASGSLTHFSSILHDVTEMRHAEMLLLDQSQELEAQTEELRQQTDELLAARDSAESANAAKSQFLAHMSHELRTPLTAIIGFSRVLEANRGGRLAPLEKTYAERVSQNAVRLLGLINQLLDLSKVEAGHSDLDIADVDVGALAADVVSDLQSVARPPGVELRASLPPAAALVRTDGTKLRQVLVNLVSNALKFTSAGSVTVSVVLGNDGVPVSLAVSDTGMGIALENQANIFEPFAQEDSTITRRFGGTGLGLAITKRYCDAMGFALTLDSAPGQGSTFTIELVH